MIVELIGDVDLSYDLLKQSIINSPILNFEITDQTFGTKKKTKYENDHSFCIISALQVFSRGNQVDGLPRVKH